MTEVFSQFDPRIVNKYKKQVTLNSVQPAAAAIVDKKKTELSMLTKEKLRTQSLLP